jgi:uncharacterized membrane protein YphA (DoxX/SURF4 family)
MDQRAKLIKILFIVLQIGMGGLFIIAGTLKILDPSNFLTAIETFQLLPYPLAYFIAYLLPWMEIICGLALIFKKGQMSALIILTALITVFIIALALSWGRGLDIVCGCFGNPGSLKTNYPWLLTRNFALLAVIILILIRNKKLCRR